MRRRLDVLILSLLVVTALVLSSVCAIAQTAGGDTEKRVNIQFKDTPVRSALEVLFQGSGLSYVIDPSAQGIINVNLIDVPFSTALNSILKASRLTVVRENGVYMISPQKEYTEVASADIPVDTDIEIEQEKLFEKIPIGYADVNEIASIFGVQSTSRYGQTGYGQTGYGGGMMGGYGGGMMGGYGGGMMGGSRYGGGYGGSYGGYGQSGYGGYGGSYGGYGGSYGGYGGSYGGYGGSYGSSRNRRY